MKVVKIALATLIMGVSTLSIAQNTEKRDAKRAEKAEVAMKTAEQRVAARMEVLNSKLGLTDAQANKIKTAMLEREKTRDELRAKYGTDKKALKEKMKASNKKCREVMMSTLTDEQKTKLKELHKKQKTNKEAEKEGKEKSKKEKSDVDELEESEM
ncbi:MAG: hypothetical protein H7331_10585 [Bacteroidia bacterium]|nr:hypothetical protein [Bacteroidia bacterium]